MLLWLIYYLLWGNLIYRSFTIRHSKLPPTSFNFSNTDPSLPNLYINWAKYAQVDQVGFYVTLLIKCLGEDRTFIICPSRKCVATNRVLTQCQNFGMLLTEAQGFKLEFGHLSAIKPGFILDASTVAWNHLLKCHIPTHADVICFLVPDDTWGQTRANAWLLQGSRWQNAEMQI